MHIDVSTQRLETMTAMKQHHVLLVDDEPAIRETLQVMLETDETHAYTIEEVGTGKAALKILLGDEETRPDLVFLDHFLPDLQGTQVLQEMLDHGVDVPVVLITGNLKADNTILGIRLGAFDVLTKPFDADQVLNVAHRALRHQEFKHSDETADIPETDPGEKIIGRGAQMVEIFRTVALVARSQATILITGENGTGKTMLADMIHQSSDRRSKPFITVNCAGIPETLLEGELFGSEKGAYTDSKEKRIGRFEAADKGTIFLDEIGEMSLATQAKLLKVLQDRTIERLGSNTPIKVDVRIIAATNKNLSLEVQERRFREDLFYRLNVISIPMPAMRARKQDIPALVSHFLEKHRFSPVMPPARITPEALAKLESHDWPGNVRELDNVIQRAVVFCRGEVILPEHIVFSRLVGAEVLDVAQLVKQNISLEAILDEARLLAVREALRLHDQHVPRAAETLGMTLDEFNALRVRFDI